MPTDIATLKPSVLNARQRCGRKSHCHIVMTTEDYFDDSRPSVPELLVLVSWMLEGMRHQETVLSKQKIKTAKTNFHMVFPVCSRQILIFVCILSFSKIPILMVAILVGPSRLLHATCSGSSPLRILTAHLKSRSRRVGILTVRITLRWWIYCFGGRLLPHTGTLFRKWHFYIFPREMRMKNQQIVPPSSVGRSPASFPIHK
jgi:hypothetical protein